MHSLEPFYQWRDLYKAEEDEQSPFYEREYSEMYFTNAIYNHVIHPQWDDFGSTTLYSKILYADYNDHFAVIELMGEWNDCINNDVMFLKREVIEPLIDSGINKFILIGENVLNFHADTEDYYEEWYDDLGDGWIIALNFLQHVREEMANYRLDYYLNYGAELDEMPWRTLNPKQLYKRLEQIINHRLV